METRWLQCEIRKLKKNFASLPDDLIVVDAACVVFMGANCLIVRQNDQEEVEEDDSQCQHSKPRPAVHGENREDQRHRNRDTEHAEERQDEALWLLREDLLVETWKHNDLTGVDFFLHLRFL